MALGWHKTGQMMSTLAHREDPERLRRRGGAAEWGPASGGAVKAVFPPLSCRGKTPEFRYTPPRISRTAGRLPCSARCPARRLRASLQQDMQHRSQIRGCHSPIERLGGQIISTTHTPRCTVHGVEAISKHGLPVSPIPCRPAALLVTRRCDISIGTRRYRLASSLSVSTLAVARDDSHSLLCCRPVSR